MADPGAFGIRAEEGKYEMKGTPESPVLCPGTGEVKAVGQLSNLRAGFRLLKDLRAALHADVVATFRAAYKAASRGESETSRRARRNAARALFAYIEGTVYAMKDNTLRIDEILKPLKGDAFTREELAKLKEKRLNEKGELTEQPWRLPARDNLKFAFDMFVRRFPGYKLKTSGGEWDAYIRAIDIRDRLTHPKKMRELTVTRAEFDGVLFKTAMWFNRAVEEVLVSVHAQAKHGPATPLPD